MISAESINYRCICCESGEKSCDHLAKERMYGDEEIFHYAECAQCGTLQLLDPPVQLQRYYREPYSSWTPVPAYVDRRIGLLSHFLRGKRFEHHLGYSSLTGKLATLLAGPPAFPFSLDWFSRSSARSNAWIFDFGCGNARLLRYLHYNGFRNLFGHDAFAQQTQTFTGVRLFDQIPEHLTNSCDLVMAHHVLEHLSAPVETLSALRSLLKPNGVLLIRVPISQTYAWRHYGTRWVQLDAPRHHFLPSEKGMRSLLARAGFTLTHVEYDASEFQFAGSEQYLLDIPMFDPERSYIYGRDLQLFSSSQLDDWKRQSLSLNAQGDGDQACFFATLTPV